MGVQREPSYNSTTPDPEVLEKRKPTRVPTKLGTKKNGNYSPVTAERALGSSVDKADQELELQDLDDHQGNSPVVPYRKKVKVRIP
jgi:hypothetical protein